MASKRIVVGVTGASGAVYPRRLVDLLERLEAEVHLVASPFGQRLLRDELDLHPFTVENLLGRPSARVQLHPFNDVACALASGSFLTDGMVICPCSTNTLGAVASGLADNLITRAAHVHLKERRRLILVHRETPVTRIELQNMLRVAEAGGIICPAAPGFYLRPRTIDDLVDFVVGKVLDLLEVVHDLPIRWPPPPPP